MNYAAQRLAEATAKRNAVLGSLGAHLAVDPGETVEQRAVLGAEALHEHGPIAQRHRVFVTLADMLAGRPKEIAAARDRKL